MKSILLHIHQDEGLESRLQVALDLARSSGGHVTCLQANTFRNYIAMDPLGGAQMVPVDLPWIREQEAKERRNIETRLGREDVSWDWRNREGDVVRALLTGARLADVIVVTLATGGWRAQGDSLPIVAELAVSSRCPILAVPPSIRSLDAHGKAMVAWDGSHEAGVALRASLPLLTGASEVHIVTVEEKEKQDFPALEAAEYLARHDIEAEVHEWPRKGRTVGETLANAVEEVGAAWMVMGAFGHSRFRETVFGGVTRHLLAEARVPLLLAH